MATVKYVSPSGGGTGDSTASPWTLAQANSNAGPDIEFVLAAGDYSTGISPTLSGSPGTPVVYRAADGATVRIQANSVLSSRGYVTLRNVTLYSASNQWLLTNGSSNHLVLEGVTVDSENAGITASDPVGTSFPYVGMDVQGSYHTIRSLTLKTWYGGDALRVQGHHHLVEDVDARYGDNGHGTIMNYSYNSTFRRCKIRNLWSRAGQNDSRLDIENHDCLFEDCDFFDCGWDGTIQTYGESAKTAAAGYAGTDGPGDENLWKPGGSRNITRNCIFLASNLWAGNAQSYAAVGQIGNYSGSPYWQNLRFYHCLFLDNANEFSDISFTFNSAYTHYKDDNRFLNCIFQNAHTYSINMVNTGNYLLTHYFTNNIITDGCRRAGVTYSAEQMNANTGGFFPHASGNSSAPASFVGSDYTAVHADRSRWINRANFVLAQGSNGENGAAPLATLAADATAATTLTVSDAYAFYDGNGIPGEVGDTIIIGDSGSVTTTVTGKPSATTITVSPAVSASSGQNIWLQRYGVSPDIGLVYQTEETPVAISATILANSTAGNLATSLTTASITPTNNRTLLLLFGFNNANATTAPTISSISNSAGLSGVSSWTAIASSTREAGGGDAFVAAYWATTTSSPGTGTVTVNLSGQITAARCLVVELDNAASVSPVVQFKTGTNAAATPSLTLDSAPSATSMVVGLIVARSDADGITEGSGFTEFYDGTVGTAGYQAQYILNTGASAVGWSGAGTAGNAYLAFEIAAAAAATYTLTADPVTYSWAGQDASFAAARSMTGAVGTYTLTGQSAALARVFALAAAAGSYTLTGNATGLRANYALPVEAGTLAFAGIAAALRVESGGTPTDRPELRASAPRIAIGIGL